MRVRDQVMADQVKALRSRAEHGDAEGQCKLGATRMPFVQEKLRQLFNQNLRQSLNPGDVVAVGAGIQGGILNGDVKDVLPLGVTPLAAH